MVLSKNEIAISGFVKPEFEPVHEAFVDNFERRKELGAVLSSLLPRGSRGSD